MGRRLNTYVHVVELDTAGAQTGRSAVFGPDDELPDWAVAAISNPRVWTDAGDQPESPHSTAVASDPVAATAGPTEPDQPPSPEPASPPVPPRSGPGSGAPAWAAYAAAMGVEVPDGTGRADIITALDAAGVATQ